ncbi:MAG: sulfite exporter TauE/SafE family protein [Terracidiphilus sp.]
MMPVSFSTGAGEALVLGLATGPVCLASCGPAVLPWMLTQPEGVRKHFHQLVLFLAARLVAYLLFATMVWYLGSALLRTWFGRTWTVGAIDLLLAAALLVYAARWPRFKWRPWRRAPRLVQIGEPARQRRNGAVALGFLTGINLCPPFLVAGVEAAQLNSLPMALLFFVFFFAGTAVWFVPFLTLGFVRRTPALQLVARMTAVLLACWFGFSGIAILIERIVYG